MDPHTSNVESLFNSIQFNNIELVETILKQNIDPNSTNEYDDTKKVFFVKRKINFFMNL